MSKCHIVGNHMSWLICILTSSSLFHQETEGLPEKSDAKRSLDFLDIILTAKDDEGNGLSDLDIRNEVDTFLFEGMRFMRVAMMMMIK